jgi:hypothetical protein
LFQTQKTAGFVPHLQQWMKGSFTQFQQEIPGNGFCVFVNGMCLGVGDSFREDDRRTDGGEVKAYHNDKTSVVNTNTYS